MSLATVSRSLFVVTLTVIVLVSCGKIPDSDKTYDAPPGPVGVRSGPLWEEPQFSEMMKAYHEALPGKRKVLELNMNVAYATFKVQDPAKPENVDQYTYQDGKLSGPVPVRLHLFGGKLEDSLFDLDEVAIDKIPELARVAMEKIPLEGGRVTGASVGHDLVDLDGKVHIEIDVEGTRKSGTLKADIKGNVEEAGEDA